MTPPGPPRPAAVVLAAGAGTRLRPLTTIRPKALCPVGDRPLLDWALQRVRPHSDRVAVNAHHHADQVAAHLRGQDVHLSVEEGRALGTAGALGNLRDWLDGSPVLVTNADAWHPAEPDPLAPLVTGWAGDRPRLLCVRVGTGGDFGDLRYVGSALLPWWAVRDLEPVPSGLYEVSWRALGERDGLELVLADGEPVDCGIPADYLRANLRWSGGESVVGAGAVVEGEVERSVVWPGERVGPAERLVEAVRAGGRTVDARQPRTADAPVRADAPGE